MQIKPEQVAGHLGKRGLDSVYLLAGDEPLLLHEAAGAVRACARAAGFSERQVLHAESGFDWSDLGTAANSLSLFAQQRIIEVHLAAAGPGKDGSSALKAYATRPPPDTILIVLAGALDASQRKSAWTKALDAAGVFAYAWPFAAEQLPGWIRHRAERAGLRLNDDTLALLAARTEGNLLAADQEIQRLALLFPDGAVDVEGLRAATADSARFDIFDLPAKALAGDTAGVVRSLTRLREEGVDPVPILWALVADLRLLFRTSVAARRGNAAAVLDKVRLPPQRKRQIADAAPRQHPRKLLRLLSSAAHIDRINKGMASGRAWDELVTLALALAGQPARERFVATGVR